MPVDIRREIITPCQNAKKIMALTHKSFVIGLYQQLKVIETSMGKPVDGESRGIICLV
jgi:hypothetical protein